MPTTRSAQDPAPSPGTQRRRLPAPLWRYWYPPLVCLVAVLTAGAAGGGFILQRSETDPQAAISAAPLYKTIQLFLFDASADEPHDNYLLVAARILASMLFLMVSAAVIWRITRDTTLFPIRLLRRGHTVICGLGQIGLQVLEDLAAQGNGHQVVVVEPDEANVWLHHARAAGADIVHGDATRQTVLEQARAAQATRVFAVTGDDGSNLEIAAELAALTATRGRPSPGADAAPEIHAHVLDVNVGNAFQQALGDGNKLKIKVFNVIRNAAAELITEQLWPWVAKRPDEVSHFVLIGFGPMAQTLAVQLAQLAHLPNLKRSRLTIAERNVAAVGREFLARYPRFTAWNDRQLGVAEFSSAADHWSGPQEPLPEPLGSGDPDAIEYAVNAEFLELTEGVAGERFARQLLQRLEQPGVKPVVFVCNQRDRESFQTAVRLRECLDCLENSQLNGSDIPIFAWLPKEPALADVFRNQTKKRLSPFGSCATAAALQTIQHPIRDDFAKLIHQSYEQREIESARKSHAAAWTGLDENLRESNRQAADHLPLKLAYLGYRLTPCAADAPRQEVAWDTLTEQQFACLFQMEHNRWVAERLLGGWRFAPAPQRDKTKKRHDWLVPWSKLPDEARQKDEDQIRFVLRQAQQGRYQLVPR